MKSFEEEHPDIPIVPMEKLVEHLYQSNNISPLDRNRPYEGQPWTDQGERGKTLVAGLTMRDVMDCFVLGWLQATGRCSLAESGNPSYNDLYEEPPEDFKNFDPIAIGQQMINEIEKRMGIWPNIPKNMRTSE